MNLIDDITSEIVMGYERATGRPAALLTPQEYLLFREEAKKDAAYSSAEAGLHEDKSRHRSENRSELMCSATGAAGQAIRKPVPTEEKRDNPIIADHENQMVEKTQQAQPRIYENDLENDDADTGNGLFEMLKGIPG